MMSTSALVELIAQFPPVTPHRLCNPLYCKNSNMKTPSLAKAIEIEEVLLKFFQEDRLNCIIGMISNSGETDTILRLLADSAANSKNSNIHSIENKKVLEKFKIDLKNAIVAALFCWEEQGWDRLIGNISCHMVRPLALNSASLCLCSVAEPSMLRMLRDHSEYRQLDPEIQIKDIAGIFSQTGTPHFQEYQSQMKVVKKWNEEESKKFTFDISSIFRNVFQIALAGTEAMLYFVAYDRLVGGVAMLEYGRIMNDSQTNYPGAVVMVPFSFQQSLYNVSDTGTNFPWLKTLAQRLDALKQLGDQMAHKKDYAAAIALYIQLNTLPAVDNSVKLNSLTNCAAIRLRLSDTEPWQLPYAIMECTFALEIDPNHGKALFRRGLALALLKKWDEAFLDFQRAVELDSRSPAAKELAVALRQVGRRNEA